MNDFPEDFFQEHPTYIFSAFQIEVLKRLEPSLNFLSQSAWKRWMSSVPFKGVYLYGAPGGGKTAIMEYFFHALPEAAKHMTHFHSFLFAFHQKMQMLETVKNPFTHLVEDFAKEFRVLCLDEFFIDNIADAMILERFLRSCAQHNIFVFLTSNTTPNNLYQGGLHRERFLTCIEFISKEFLVLALETQEDYRKYENWGSSQMDLQVSYPDLCEKPLGTREYTRMAEKFIELEISDFPTLNTSHLDSLKRLIVCTDIFYASKKRLKVTPHDLLQLNTMKTQLEGMERMISRLQSMMDHKK